MNSFTQRANWGGRSLRRFVLPIVFLLLTNSADAQSKNDAPPTEELSATIAALDGALFGAYNNCQIDKFDALLSDDIEFYHDQGGVTLTRQGVTESVRKNICGGDRRVRRELVEGSLEVDAIKNYGAVEIGAHRFYQTAAGQPEKLTGIAKFVMLWQKKDGVWKLTRVISYAHKPIG